MQRPERHDAGIRPSGLAGASATDERPAANSPDRSERTSGRLFAPRATGRTSWWILPAILAVAAAIRVPGIAWGLPARLHPDEPVVQDAAIDMIARHSFTPDRFDRPDHFEIKIDSVLYRLYSWIAGSGRTAPEMYAHDATPFVIISRAMTVATAVGAVAFAFFIAKRFGLFPAAIAALLFAVFPPLVENSSYATPDVPLTFLLCGVLLFSQRYLERRTWVQLLLACAFVALAVSAKYPGVLGAASVAAVVVVVGVRTRNRRRAAAHLALAPVFFLVSLFVISPVLFTRFSQVVAQLSAQGTGSHLGASGLDYPGRLVFYGGFIGASMGVILVAAALIGVHRCVRERLVAAVPLAGGLVYWIGLSAVPLEWDRWSLPMSVTPLLLAAIGAGAVATWIGARIEAGQPRARGTAAGVVVVAAVAALAQVLAGAAVAAAFAAPDTRVAALPSLGARDITAANTAYDGYTPFDDARAGTIADDLRVQNGVVIPKHPGLRYVMISSYMLDRYTAAGAPASGVANLYRDVEKLPVVARWVPVPTPAPNWLEPVTIARSLQQLHRFVAGGWSGPTIEVYRLPTAPPPRAG
jgi:hypothetical protein